MPVMGTESTVVQCHEDPKACMRETNYVNEAVDFSHAYAIIDIVKHLSIFVEKVDK